MNNNFVRIWKLFITTIFLIFSLSSCSSVISKIAEHSPSNHKNLVGLNNFDSLIEDLVDQSYLKLQKYIAIDDVILVSDFVNLDKLKNRSKLGFLLSDHLKNELLNKDILVREVELSDNFQYGKSGLNLLTRNRNDINKKFVDNSKYAVVGTYSITRANLIVFIKLIDIRNGNILSSSSAKTSIDDEILELEGLKDKKMIIRQPIVL